MEKAYSGDLIKITKAFDEPYNVGDILEVDMRQSDMGACDDDVLMTTEGYVVEDGHYTIFKAAVRIAGHYTDQQVSELKELYKTSDELGKDAILQVCKVLKIQLA